jgi:hypothetical protein
MPCGGSLSLNWNRESLGRCLKTAALCAARRWAVSTLLAILPQQRRLNVDLMPGQAVRRTDTCRGIGAVAVCPQDWPGFAQEIAS